MRRRVNIESICINRLEKSLMLCSWWKYSVILQAAHCVAKESLPKSWDVKKVRLGEWDLTTNPDCQEIDGTYYCAYDTIDVDIAAIYKHEKYDVVDPEKSHDIALIKLKSPVAFSQFVRPICSPINSESSLKTYITEYGTATVIGFGKTETGRISERLRKADVDIVANRECKKKYRSQGRTILDTQICAARHQTDTWWAHCVDKNL